jgi:transcription antitermination factor NusG
MKQNEKKWYAVYVAPRAEKKVSERFVSLGIEHYLPLQKVKRIWSDRVKEVIVPVVNGYIFVKINEADFKQIVNVYGALNFVSERGNPVSIPENQIITLQLMVDRAEAVVEFSNEQFEKGESIIITKGPLEGVVGELIEMKGSYKVLVRLEKFGCALTTVPKSFVKKV